MQNQQSLAARLTALILAGVCGLLVLVFFCLLTIGYFIRAVGSVVVNVATWAQCQVVWFMHWTDKKLFPASIN